MDKPTNRLPTCVICGGAINEANGETPVWIEPCDQDDYGNFDGEAYHMGKCEDEVIETVHCEIESGP